MAAGRAARTVAWITGNVLGDWAVRSGWLARASAILEEAGEDGPERGWVLLIRAFAEPDAQVRESLPREAIAIGRRVGDPDIEFLAVAYLGGVYLMVDRVEEGLALCDEAMAALLRRRADRARHRRRDLLRPLLGVRAGQRRPPRGPVDPCRRRAGAAEQRRGRVLPCPLRRHPHGGRPLGPGGGRAARGGQAVRPGRARRGARPRSSGWPTCASGRAAWRRPPSCSRASRSIRTRSVRWPRSTSPRGRRRSPGTCSSGPPALPTRRSPTVGEFTMAGPLLALLVDVHLEEGNVDAAARVAERLDRIAEAQRGPYLQGRRRARQGPGLRRRRGGRRAGLPARGAGGIRQGPAAGGARVDAPGAGPGARGRLPRGRDRRGQAGPAGLRAAGGPPQRGRRRGAAAVARRARSGPAPRGSGR